ncbi:MAG TPA: hypothetical protein VFX48_09775 [Saprospiraceae bacterium]|nr:hypothetical protein [Saprospiraceae bacterium]
MLKGSSYIEKNWFLIVFTAAFTFLPIALCLFVLTQYSTGRVPLDKWFANMGITGNALHIHNVLLAFILVSYFILFANQLLYFIEAETKAFDYRGSNKAFKRMNLISLLIDVAVLIGIPVFLFRTTNYIDILQGNRYLSIVIFLAFTLSDGLMWYQECLAINHFRDPKKIRLCRNNIAFSRKSMLLINLPALTILSFSLYLHDRIEGNRFYLSHLNGQDTDMTDHIKLFMDGFETSLVFTTIIITQMIFAVLKIKWSYRKFEIENMAYKDSFHPRPKNLRRIANSE